MKKILYITNEDNLDLETGVVKKIKAQIQALEKKNFQVILSGNATIGYIVKDTINNLEDFYEYKGRNSQKKIFLFMAKYIDVVDIIYIRRMMATKYLNDFVELCNSKNKKVIIEIPTYPYENEFKGFKSTLGLMVDRYYRKKLYKYVDRVVTYSSDLFIFDTPCINISNGINSAEIIDTLISKKADTIKFISVSSLYNWHGVDRFIKAMNKLKEQKPDLYSIIEFHVVGPRNDYYEFLNKMKNELNVEKVIFHGFLKNQDLNLLYQNMNIAVGSLGRHRTGNFNLSSLKNKEYIAKGLPIIYSENDMDLDDSDFVYKATCSEELINIGEILDWYNSLILDNTILDLAREYTWDKQMEKIVDYINAS